MTEHIDAYFDVSRYLPPQQKEVTFCHVRACVFRSQKCTQLIDYGYIQDTELDSDDEHEYLDDLENETVHDSDGQTTSAPEQQSLAGGDAASSQQQHQPAADGSHPPPEGIPPEQAQQNTAESRGEEGVENDTVEPPSPSAAVARVRGQEDGQGAEGRGRVRWAPKRMFMDEVRWCWGVRRGDGEWAEWGSDLSVFCLNASACR